MPFILIAFAAFVFWSRYDLSITYNEQGDSYIAEESLLHSRLMPRRLLEARWLRLRVHEVVEVVRVDKRVHKVRFKALVMHLFTLKNITISRDWLTPIGVALVLSTFYGFNEICGQYTNRC